MKVSRTVLLIEQSLENRENFMEYLELFDYSVLPVNNSVDGFKLAITHQPDLIICNSNSVGNCVCIDTHTLLKSHEDTKNIPLIITTTNSTSQFKGSCYKNGVEGFLLKPFAMEYMLDMISEFILKANVNSTSAA